MMEIKFLHFRDSVLEGETGFKQISVCLCVQKNQVD